ncbi:MAG TPA: type II secretion system protein GspJ, partial [Polyangiaceae bacterium]
FDLKYLEPLTSQWVDSWDTTQVTGQPNRLPLEIAIRLVLKGVPGAPSLVFATKLSMPMQQPLSFGVPR